MRKIAHISDIHFGTEDFSITEGLINDLNIIAPDVLVVSGDLTQRARNNQFVKAGLFLSRLNFSQIIIPGNHDIPLFDIIRRLFTPLKRYNRFITENMYPFFEDDEIAILGINTARSLAWKEGRISAEQINNIDKLLCEVSNEKFKILVTHHPFIPPPESHGIKIVGRSVLALKTIEKCHVDLLLAGHLHHGYSGDIRSYYPSAESSIISVQAGTAISRRRRNELNAYNLITSDKNTINIEIRTWNGECFFPVSTAGYKLVNKEWIKST